jgi:hypothetical protein
VLSLIASLVVASCGEAGSQTSSGQTGDARVITRADILRYPPRSPERALWRWFQAVQFADPNAVRAATTTQSLKGVTAASLDYAVRSVGTAIGYPKFVAARRNGNEAAIRVFVSRSARLSQRFPPTMPRTFYLIRSNKDWKINDITYLLALSDAIYAQQHTPS